MDALIREIKSSQLGEDPHHREAEPAEEELDIPVQGGHHPHDHIMPQGYRGDEVLTPDGTSTLGDGKSGGEHRTAGVGQPLVVDIIKVQPVRHAPVGKGCHPGGHPSPEDQYRAFPLASPVQSQLG
ncbi:MAG: hypothetical protein V1849_05655 [Chloroflexota bacterium]